MNLYNNSSKPIVVTIKRRLPNRRDVVLWIGQVASQHDQGMPMTHNFGGADGSLVLSANKKGMVYYG